MAVSQEKMNGGVQKKISTSGKKLKTSQNDANGTRYVRTLIYKRTATTNPTMAEHKEVIENGI